MSSTHLTSQGTRLSRINSPVRKFLGFLLMAAGIALLFCTSVHAQGGVPLIPVATDQSPLNLSNQFGIPAGMAINQASDSAFVGSGDTALFLRPAGAPSAMRLLQIYDQAPGFPGSEILSFSANLSINASKVLLFAVRFTGSDHVAHSALLTYEGTNYRSVVSSDQTAPGSNGATYGLDLTPGSIDDSGDVDFAVLSVSVTSTGPVILNTLYILPSGTAAAKRIVGSSDTPPPACTWCVASTASPFSFFNGTPVGTGVLIGNPVHAFVPGLNARGQVLLGLWGGLFVGSKDGTLTLVPMAASGPCSPQAVTTGTVVTPVFGAGAILNNTGAVTFTNPPNSGSAAICVAPSDGSPPNAAVSSGDPAPAGVGGGTIASPVALGFDDSGDIVFQSSISGSNLTTSALLRYHPSNSQLSDVVAYDCEQAPGTNGSLFSPLLVPTSCGATISIAGSPSAFSGVSIANNGSVSFNASLTVGGSAIYRQTRSTPEFISFDSSGASTAPIGVVKLRFSSDIVSDVGTTEILDNGSVFFASFLTSGAADFAVYLGTPGNVQSLMSTADLLPSGAVTLLGSAPPKAAGRFIAFAAQPAAGRTNLLESDLTSGTIRRVASDNDPGFAASGNKALASNFFLNDRGQIVFEASNAGASGGSGVAILGGTPAVDTAWVSLPSTCGAVYLWSPSGGLAKVAAPGDAVPNSSSKFSCVALNEASPSPLSQGGEVAFFSPSPFGAVLPCFLCGFPAGPPVVNGDFLYSSTGTISEMAVAGDTLPGESLPTSFVPSLSLPANSAGQVAFGAELGTSTWGFYLRNGDAVQKVIANGDTVPDAPGATFGFPHFIAGLTDAGRLAFTASTSAASDGLFLAQAGGAVQTIALDGGPAPVPGGGTFSLAPSGTMLPNPPPGTFTVGISPFQNFAAINSESDVAFGSAITGGNANSGYFRLLQNGPSAGTLQAVVLQGQAAPGGGTFNAVPIPLNIFIFGNSGTESALGPDGSLAFLNPFTDPSGSQKEGMFVARPDGTILEVLANDDLLPGGGFLTSLSLSPKFAAGDAGKFVFLAGIEGGSARRGVFVTAIPLGTAGTTTVLGLLQSPAVAGQPTMLSAMVTSTAPGSPSGSVTFFDNGISLGSGALNSSGQVTLTTSSLAAGPGSFVAQYGGDSNYAPGDSPVESVVVVGFAPPPAQLSVTAGHTLVIPLMAFAPSGSNLSFTLSCSSLPANATCMFDVNPVTPGPTGTTIKLTLTTMAGAKLPPVQPPQGTPALRDLGLAAPFVALFAVAALVWRRAPRWRLATCTCLATLALALVLGGCGAFTSSGPAASGTPGGAASFTVTGISGTTTISAVVKVTVQ